MTRQTKHVRAGWTEVVLVCRKCSKKLGGGFGPKGRQPLAKALKAFARTEAERLGRRPGKARRAGIGIVEVGCLDICPKGAVVALRAGAPGDWLVVPDGRPIEVVARDLGLTVDGLPSPHPSHAGEGESAAVPVPQSSRISPTDETASAIHQPPRQA